jgi:hypothetical protein
MARPPAAARPQCGAGDPGSSGGGAAGGLGGGRMGIGKSKARRYDQETDPKVTFDDVAGIDEAETDWSRSISSRSTSAWAARLRKACCWSAARNRKDRAGKGGRRERRGAFCLVGGRDPQRARHPQGHRCPPAPAPGTWKLPGPGAGGKADSASGPCLRRGASVALSRPPAFQFQGGEAEFPCWHPPCSIEFWWAG